MVLISEITINSFVNGILSAGTRIFNFSNQKLKKLLDIDFYFNINKFSIKFHKLQFLKSSIDANIELKHK